jgi:Raf kinase inhibitor-like YbhB/YbcL family protein
LLQGKNERGSLGYFGAKPPTGDPAHRYYFQIFALDKQLDVEFGLTRDQLIAAMEGHVLGAGFIMGTFAR